MTFTVSFSSRNSPFTSTVIFLVRSPFATAVVTVAMFRTCADDARHFARGMHQIADQPVDRRYRVRPRVRDISQGRALGNPPFLTHHPTNSFQLLGQPLILVDDLVESVRNFAGYPCPIVR